MKKTHGIATPVLATILCLALPACGRISVRKDDSPRTTWTQDHAPPAVPETATNGTTQRPTAPTTADDRFRRDFGRRGRFLKIEAQDEAPFVRYSTYVLDRTTGCVYQEDSKSGRHPILLQSGRWNCTYRD